jgi:hypothetical protein
MAQSVLKLRSAAAALRAEADPLQQQLQRLDAAVERLDVATAERDRLLEEHDRMVAESICHRLGRPAMDPRLNLVEIDLRKAAGEARAALMVRPDVEEQLAALNGRLTQLEQQLEEQVWLDVPAAAAHLFAAAEASRREYERALARIDSVAAHAHQQAHIQQDGAPPQMHPAYRCWQRLQQMTASLTAALGGGTVRDFATGPELVREVSEGRGELGDISRWQPPRQGAEDGSRHINRGPVEPAPPPVENWPNPATDPDGAWWRMHPQPPADELLP